ncbi:MAG: DJ-1/PfpI family protein, partial [Bacteroidota bacterium]
MQIAIVLYDGMTALDAIGPYEVLRTIPDADLR